MNYPCLFWRNKSVQYDWLYQLQSMVPQHLLCFFLNRKYIRHLFKVFFVQPKQFSPYSLLLLLSIWFLGPILNIKRDHTIRLNNNMIAKTWTQLSCDDGKLYCQLDDVIIPLHKNHSIACAKFKSFNFLEYLVIV